MEPKTRIRITIEPEAEARRTHGAMYTQDDWKINATGRVFRARLGGLIVWAYANDVTGATAFVTQDQANALGLCPYLGCGKIAEYIQVSGIRCAGHASFGASPLAAR